MNRPELEAQAKALAPVIARAVAKAVEPILQAFEAKAEEVQRQIKALAEAPSIDTTAIAEEAAKLVKAPEPVDLDALAKAAFALVDLPEPEAIDLDALAKSAASYVVAEPGKDAEPVDFDAVVKAAVALITVPPVDLDEVASRVPKPQDGKSVPVEEVAAMVEAEVQKRMSELKLPEDGKPGDPGRDALDLVIEPEIDHARSYPRSTYAMHLGGLWKSYQKTHGMRGWECIVEGIAGVTVTQDEERAFTLTVSKSSGEVVEKEFRMPVLLYKGVYSEGRKTVGDCVTWGGSLWVCREDTDEKPADGHKAWQLAVKKGRDAKASVPLPRPEHTQVTL